MAVTKNQHDYLMKRIRKIMASTTEDAVSILGRTLCKDWSKYGTIYNINTTFLKEIKTTIKEDDNFLIPTDIFKKVPMESFILAQISDSFDEACYFILDILDEPITIDGNKFNVIGQYFESGDSIFNNSQMDMQLLINVDYSKNCIPIQDLVYDGMVTSSVPKARGISMLVHHKTLKKIYPDGTANILPVNDERCKDTNGMLFNMIVDILSLAVINSSDIRYTGKCPEHKVHKNPVTTLGNVKTYDVGFRTGMVLEMYYKDPEKFENHYDSNVQVHTKKCPHVRRAHWHHYWVGSKTNRKLILKWLLPSFINFDEIDGDVPVVSHDTKI